jgi:hypothetical protein
MQPVMASLRCHLGSFLFLELEGNLYGTLVIFLLRGFSRRFSQNCEKRLLAPSCLSVCPHGTTRLPLDDFYEILYLRIFQKSAEKIEVSLKSDKNNGCFT